MVVMSTLTIFSVSISILTVISILLLRYPVRRDYLQRGQLQVHTSILQVIIFFTYGGFPIIYLPSDWPVTYVTPIYRLIGLIILTTGMAIILIGIYRLGILRSFGVQIGVLKESSYYRVSRNPQVLGCVLYVFGFIILWPSWYALGWGGSLQVILHVMVLTEEEHLHNAFGQEYENYCQNVPRYIGFPKQIRREIR